MDKITLSVQNLFRKRHPFEKQLGRSRNCLNERFSHRHVRLSLGLKCFSFDAKCDN